MVATSGPGWFLAPCLVRLTDQVDTAAPGRSEASDGSIGDRSHQGRKSDHNPDSDGLVKALDITHDPAKGCDCEEIVAAIVASKDFRVSYIIWNQQIWRSYKTSSSHPEPWTPQEYQGSNPHDKHLHLSVKRDDAYDERDWRISFDPEEIGMFFFKQKGANTWRMWADGKVVGFPGPEDYKKFTTAFPDAPRIEGLSNDFVKMLVAAGR